LISTPCAEVKKGVSGGTLLNGSYMVAIAYAIAGTKVSNYYVSNVQPVFEHQNTASSIDVDLYNLDQSFEQIQVVLISITNQQTVARLAGLYSTRQKRLSFDTIDNTWPAVPVELLPLMNPVTEKTETMYNVGDYLIRAATYSKEDFNYQPFANQIVAKWQSVEYPTNYYRAGGNKTNYLRDEVYAFFIQWVYDTGDKSSEYHIPGRGAFPNELTPVVTDALTDEISGSFNYRWLVENTATFTSNPGTILSDGGVVVGEGYMGYWESTEDYPDKKPQVWNAVTNPLAPGFNTTVNPYTGVPLNTLDLCGAPIRHHKFPDLYTHSSVEYLNGAKDRLRIMGVKFENIKAPLMNDGITPVPGIVGYQILRGTRNGNKTILAKGLINNMRNYNIPGSNQQGYFVNYPYNDLTDDPFLSTTKTKGSACGAFGNSNITTSGYNAQSAYSQSLLSFHSPDTNFTDPYLNAKELKISGEMNGNVVGKFDKSEEHPKEKLITNFAFLISAIAGVGIAMVAANGKRTIKYQQPAIPGMSESNVPRFTTYFGAPYIGPLSSTTASSAALLKTSPTLVDNVGLIAAQTALMNIAFGNAVPAPGSYEFNFNQGASIIPNLAGLTNDLLLAGVKSSQAAANTATKAFSTRKRDIDIEDGTGLKSIPGALRVLGSVPLFFNYFTQGTDETLNFFKSICSFKDFALRYHSHGYYDNYRASVAGNRRFSIADQAYIGPQSTNFNASSRINNAYRSKFVAVNITSNLQNPTVSDRTRYKATDVTDLLEPELLFANGGPAIGTLVPKDPTKVEFSTGNAYQANVLPNNLGDHQICSSHYGSLKQRIRNQYGQINGIISVPVSTCTMKAPVKGTPVKSDVLFGGDTYMGRYTEKNTFFYFYDWLYGQPDGAPLDYTRNEMIPYPRFWANFNQFETGDFMSTIGSVLTNFNFSSVALPNTFYSLDSLSNCPNGFGIQNVKNFLKFSVKNAWFYLFNSGVKDFFVESEINIDLRDWGELETELHYDPYRYTDTKALFNTKIIKSGNYYKYDKSLSISKLFLNYVSWAYPQKNNYDPYIAETCYTYNDSRVIYSNPLQYESLHDNWRDFLPNNYYDFDVPVTCIKPINKNGAMIFFDSQSPVMFQGTDQLETGLGTKLTIGDGGLFSQPLQRVVNADAPYEYASCQDTLSVINTPNGVYWMSQNQGKIFNYGGGLEELSMMDIKWWLVKYLPYMLTELYPDFQLTNNPVRGIGCQSIFDNQNGLLYFSKKDYKLRSDLPSNTTVKYNSGVSFSVYIDEQKQLDIELGDLRYFEDASWTISFDPKTKNWVSYHDWHPNIVMPGKNTFLSIDDKTIWIHNFRTDSYCNYYGKDYPFEIEYLVDTAQTVNTIRSVEYQLECYKYASNAYDRFHVLDYNFDEAVVYNTEQVSGLLKLNLQPRHDPMAMVSYPKIQASFIDIVYSKVENRYRFNQFWDITADRGEYNPNAQRMIWNTGANGYNRVLNSPNMNYNKQEFQRKKFRHYLNYVFLRKKVSGDKKMLVVFTNNKNLYSPR
jgi:hypothetical protein